MIHIATSHWKMSTWIDIQLGYIKEFLPGCKTYLSATQNVIDKHGSKFTFAADINRRESFVYDSVAGLRGSIDHCERLNGLFDVIELSSNSDDIVLFLDVDAFPIAPCTDKLHELLDSFEFVSICGCRESRLNPAFCACRVGSFKQIGASWRIGNYYYRLNDFGANRRVRLCDTGGGTAIEIRRLRKRWLQLHRCNRRNLHPVLFGIYGGLAYHNGMGLRSTKRLIPTTWIPRRNRYLLKRKRNGHLIFKVFNWIRQNRRFYRSLR